MFKNKKNNQNEVNTNDSTNNELNKNVCSEEKPKKSTQREILEWVLVILSALVIAWVIKSYVFVIAKVDGPSMNPTLKHEDRLFLWKLGYEPENGDIIVLQLPGNEPYVKRVIATEGQTVEIDFVTDEVKVDGKVIEEKYILEKNMNEYCGVYGMEKITVPKDHVFVLGDNRNNSKDSRQIGTVPEEYIMGKAMFRIWPFNSFGSLD